MSNHIRKKQKARKVRSLTARNIFHNPRCNREFIYRKYSAHMCSKKSFLGFAVNKGNITKAIEFYRLEVYNDTKGMSDVASFSKSISTPFFYFLLSHLFYG